MARDERSRWTLLSAARRGAVRRFRSYANGLFTVFDDGSSPPEEKQSRGLLFFVGTKAKHVSLNQAYVHPAGFIAANQGSVQRLADGRVFVGSGYQPYFSEFAADGALF